MIVEGTQVVAFEIIGKKDDRKNLPNRESAAKKPGMTLSERKWNTYYRRINKRFKLQTVSVESYTAKIWIQPEP